MPKRYFSSFLLSSCLVLFSCFASAAEFHVSPNGDDDNAGTSASTPWRSIAKANDAVGPGDVVYLHGGTFVDDPIRPGESGSAAAEIRYVAYQGAEPVLTSDKVDGLEVAIDLSDRSHVRIEGIHVDGVRPNPDARVRHFLNIFGGSHNTVIGCTFRYARGWHGIRLTDGAHHNKLLNNIIDVVGIYDDGTGQDWGDSVQIIGDAHHNVIEGNTFTRGSHNLLQVKGEFNVIRGNTFENDWSEILGNGKGGRNLELIGKHNLFERNIVRRAQSSVDKQANAGMKVEGQGNIVRRNFIYGNSNQGITTQSRSNQKWAHGNRIFHNTIYSNGGPAWGLNHYNGGNGVTDNVFKNNIVYANGHESGSDGADIMFELGSNPDGPIGNSIIENNLMVKGAVGDIVVEIKGGGRLTLDEIERKYERNFRKNIQASPTFVSSQPEKPADFALTPTSRGIDEGGPLTHTTASGAGSVIPVDDAGYFWDGFSIASGDRIQVGDGPALKVLAVDYSANTITVDGGASWDASAPVSLEFSGSGPDIGALEVGLPMGGSKRPKAPGGMTPRPR